MLYIKSKSPKLVLLVVFHMVTADLKEMLQEIWSYLPVNEATVVLAKERNEAITSVAFPLAIYCPIIF